MFEIQYEILINTYWGDHIYQKRLTEFDQKSPNFGYYSLKKMHILQMRVIKDTVGELKPYELKKDSGVGQNITTLTWHNLTYVLGEFPLTRKKHTDIIIRVKFEDKNSMCLHPIIHLRKVNEKFIIITPVFINNFRSNQEYLISYIREKHWLLGKQH